MYSQLIGYTFITKCVAKHQIFGCKDPYRYQKFVQKSVHVQITAAAISSENPYPYRFFSKNPRMRVRGVPLPQYYPKIRKPTNFSQESVHARITAAATSSKNLYENTHVYGFFCTNYCCCNIIQKFIPIRSFLKNPYIHRGVRHRKITPPPIFTSVVRGKGAQKIKKSPLSFPFSSFFFEIFSHLTHGNWNFDVCRNN